MRRAGSENLPPDSRCAVALSEGVEPAVSCQRPKAPRAAGDLTTRSRGCMSRRPNSGVGGVQCGGEVVDCGKGDGSDVGAVSVVGGSGTDAVADLVGGSVVVVGDAAGDVSASSHALMVFSS
jgi:hypothetical protein